MRITICGSLSFSEEMIGIAETLERMGHEVILPHTTELCRKGELRIGRIHEMKDNIDQIIEFASSIDAIRRHYHEIKKSDVVLVVNLEKRGIPNYIGANVFLEIGFAHALNKKVFLLNPAPEMDFHAEEIGIMKPVILNGDLTKISEHPMRVIVCGSMSFAREMVDAKQHLDGLGFDATVHSDTERFVNNPDFKTDSIENFNHCKENDIMRKAFEAVGDNDAILVLNLPKNGINGYIGVSTMMEIGLAYHLGKRIFLMFPPMEKLSGEMKIMKATVLNGDLNEMKSRATPKIILATKSPFRQEFFKNLGLDFTAEGSEVNEKFDGRPDSPRELVKELARRKAEAVARNHKSGIIIGFDSVMEFNGGVLEKPGSRQESFERLRMLSGKEHGFLTGIHMIDAGTGKTLSRVAETNVGMRSLTDGEINKYLDQDKKEIYMKTCLGYDSYGSLSSSFMKEISGDVYGYLQGLPMATIMEMLSEMGVYV